MTVDRGVASQVRDLCLSGVQQWSGESLAGHMGADRVHELGRAFMQGVINARWPTDETRGRGIWRLAVAQLGSSMFTPDDDLAWIRHVAEQVIRQIMPLWIRQAAALRPLQKDRDALESVARGCEREGSSDAASAAFDLSWAIDAREIRQVAAHATEAAAIAHGAYSFSAECRIYAGASALNASALNTAAGGYAHQRALALIVAIAVDAYRLCGAPGVALLDKLEASPPSPGAAP